MTNDKAIEKIICIEVPRTRNKGVETLDKLIKKFNEEFEEIREAIEMYEFNKNEDNFKNIEEECMDGIQMCVKILEYYRADIKRANTNHKEKLKGRGICL